MTILSNFPLSFRRIPSLFASDIATSLGLLYQITIVLMVLKTQV
jgi:hypothetical protein